MVHASEGTVEPCLSACMPGTHEVSSARCSLLGSRGNRARHRSDVRSRSPRAPAGANLGTPSGGKPPPPCVRLLHAVRARLRAENPPVLFARLLHAVRARLRAVDCLLTCARLLHAVRARPRAVNPSPLRARLLHAVRARLRAVNPPLLCVRLLHAVRARLRAVNPLSG